MTTATSARLGRGRPHQRALLVIAVAAGPEHDQQAAPGELPSPLERLGQPVRRVGVVDQDGEGLAGVDRLEPAPHARHRGQPVGDDRPG